MSKALDDIKVIDVSQVAAVPMCARHLADFGADVIHVENAKTGDSWRNLQAGAGGGPAGTPSDIPYNWEAYNRNKRSLGLDLSKENGRKIVYKLVKDADIFLTNLRLSERKKLGMEYETLKKINPRLVYGSVTGHGLNGPDNDMPAYDTTVYFARSGIHHMLTFPGMAAGPDPRPALGDNVAALGLAFGLMTALHARDKIGQGQEVETSLLYTGIYQLTFDMAGTLVTGEDHTQYRLDNYEGTEEEIKERDELIAGVQAAVGRLGAFYRARHPNPLANTLVTKDGKVVRFNALQPDRYWTKFCKIFEIEDLEHDPKFATIEARQENRKELNHILEEGFSKKTLDEWRPLIADIPSSPFHTLVDVMNDPQAKANDWFPTFDHPSYGPMKIMANPINLSETPATVRLPAPEFSQQTEEVLLEAGYTWDEIAQFQDEKVIP
ncbi:MAG: CoA transferase [Deltaproteobacteria bacterium]|nr:CoA transferase [Deltaproteobacteria bacterium]